MIKKIFYFGVIAPIVLIVCAIGYLLTFDPNSLKPSINERGKEAGVDIEIQGDIHWQFYPNIGLRVENIVLSDSKAANSTTTSGQSKKPLLSIGGASVAVELKPLFSRQVNVSGITIDDAILRYHVTADGKSNWDAVIDHQQAPTPSSELDDDAHPGEGPALDINIHLFAINNTAIEYHANGNTQTVTLDHLTVENFNIEGNSFPLKTQVNVATPSLPPVAISLEALLKLSTDNKSLAISDGQLNIDGQENPQPKLSGNFATTVEWGGSTPSASINTALKTENLRAWMEIFDIEQPQTAHPDTLSNASLSASINYADGALTSDNIHVQLDKTSVNNSLKITTQPTLSVQAKTTVDTINLDHYLSTTDNAEPSPPAKETELPLDMIRNLNIDYQLDAKSILIKTIPITELHIKIKGQNGVLSLNDGRMKTANGAISINGTFDAKMPLATATSRVKIENIDVAYLLEKFKQEPIMNGALNADIQANTQGKTNIALSQNMVVDIQAKSAQIKLNRINIEKRFCDAMALLQQKPVPQAEWPDYSELSPINLQAKYAKNIIKLSNLDTELQKLKANTEGQINLDTGDFSFPLKVSLAEFATSIEGCVSIEEKWRKRQIPILCDGNLKDIGAKTCLPDRRHIENLIKAQLKQKANEKIEAEKDRVEEKVKNRLEEKLKDKLSDDEVEQVKDVLKGLFKK